MIWYFICLVGYYYFLIALEVIGIYQKEDLNKTLKQASEESELKGILEYTEEPIVSADIIGKSHSSIVDGLRTLELENNKNNVIKILPRYDDEWSYSYRLVDLAKCVIRCSSSKSIILHNVKTSCIVSLVTMN
jgi:glyceraldehyde-3-phosphate dehydrogenase/erythrose-4-phosphate dehydrogenase